MPTSVPGGGQTVEFDPKRMMIGLDRRRALLGGLAATSALVLGGGRRASATPAAAANTTGLAVTDDSVTVGILHSITGTMAISETGAVEAEKLAISQINAAGGVLGRKIKIIQEDGASDWPTFAEKARKLLVSDKCASVYGCFTSASRKAVLPVFEQYDGLLYYPTFYEGLEQSKNVIYTGQEATQQTLAVLNWLGSAKKAKTFYFIGSDYIWPRTSNKIAGKHIANVLKGKVVGEDYFPLGSTQFGSVINKIKLKKPDVIFSTVVGGSNVSLYKQLKSAGIDFDKQLLVGLAVTEDEIHGIGGENYAGAYSCMKYFQSIDNPANKAFVAAYKGMWGPNAVIGDPQQAAYLAPFLWKMAVEKAGSFDVDKVVAASPGIEMKNAPEGYVKIHPNHHLWSRSRVARAKPDGQFDIVYTSDLIEPNPFPKGYQ